MARWVDDNSLLLRLFVPGLTLALAIHTVISYPLSLVAEIAASTLLLVAGAVVVRWQLSRRRGKELFPSASSSSSLSLTAFLLVFSTAVTVQTLTARELYGSPTAMDGTPGYVLASHLLHYLVVAVVVWFGAEKSREVGVGVAILFTSIFYSPMFATPEAAPPFIPLAALAMVLLVEIHLGPSSRKTFHVSFFAPLLLFVVLVWVACLFSYSPASSLVWLLKLLTLLLFTFSIPFLIHTLTVWKRLALLVVLVSVGLPVILSLFKLVVLSWQLGMWPALHYRMNLTELGRANLIARTLMVGGPLLIAQAVSSRRRFERILWWSLSVFTLFVFATCQSWGGWIGLGVTIVFFIYMIYGSRWAAWRQAQSSKMKKYALYTIIIVLIGISLLGVVKLAPESNEGSFNGRLFQFRAALIEIVHHPLLGMGPGFYYLKSRYAAGLNWLVNTQTTWDHPLLPEQWLRTSSRLHTHNLYLELAVGIGLPGLAVFIWFLVRLFRFGLQVHSQSTGHERTLLAGCLVGIVAALGWGLLDVMEISPPFFTFPTWALVGLVWAAPQVFDIALVHSHESQKFAHRPKFLTFPILDHVNLSFVFRSIIFVMAFIAVIVPLSGNFYYRAGYAAYKEQQWAIAVSKFKEAASWEPLNANYQQLRGEALINLSQYAEATAAYERALYLKRDYAPYLAQLGWLYWLQGDLIQATDNFEKAVEMDPREAWRDGLHADLGLAYMAQGRVEEAVLLFKETIELDPQMAHAPYWIRVLKDNGNFDVVLDPAYAREWKEGGDSFRTRILTHIGEANYTRRLFVYSLLPTLNSLSLNRVLDGIEEDYQAALEAGSHEAPRLLATVAEAAKLAGLNQRAENSYLAFQQMYPNSAYGFRELGVFYRDQSRLQEAQVMLERAVQVSTQDTDSWLELADVYLDRGLLLEAEQALNTIYKLEPLEVRLYKLRARYYQQREDLTHVADALRQSLVIEDSVDNRLKLAELYRLLNLVSQSNNQCQNAADALMRAWSPLLDPQLRQISECLTADVSLQVSSLNLGGGNSPDVIRQIMMGHIYRAQGQLDQALVAYQVAAVARPDEGAPHYFLGETYQALGQLDLATDEYHQAALSDPLESLPWLALGRMQWAQGQRQSAIESFRAAVEATPGWGEAHVALGNALLATGDQAGATVHFQQAQWLDEGLREGLSFDFGAQLASARIESPGSDYVRNDYFTISGNRQRVLFTHPASRVSYTLTVPVKSTVAFDIALSPDSWTQPGDGVAFAVYLQSAQETQQVFSAYIDPKHNQVDRGWRPYTIDLTAYTGQVVTIIFETTCGPAGDCRYDWAGWGESRLLEP